MAQLSSLLVTGASRLLGKVYCEDLAINKSLTVSTLSINGNTETEGTLNIGKNTASNALIYLNNKLAFKGIDTWLRINEGATFTSGTYFGNGIIRTDGTFQLGDSGSKILFNTSSAKFTVPVNISNNLSVTGSITTSTFVANNATFTNATINDTLKAYKYELSTIQDLGGEFCVAPTIYIQTGATVNVSKASSTTITVTIKDTKAITSDTIQGVRWSASSKIKFQGKIDGVAIRCNGVMANKLNTDANTMALTLTVDSSIADHFATAKNSATYSDISVMLYQRYGKQIGTTSNIYSPVGIRMSAYGSANSAPYVDIWGSKSGTDPDTVYTVPSVRLGYLGDLSVTLNGSSTKCVGYGLYADNAYLDGTIISASGTIGGFNIGTNALTNGTWGTDGSVMICTGSENSKSIGGSSAQNGWCFTAGSKFGVTKNGNVYATGGKIGGFNIGTNAFYTNKNSISSDISGIYMDSVGQINFGNASNYIKYANNKIDIKTDWLSFSSDSGIKLSSTSNSPQVLINSNSIMGVYADLTFFKFCYDNLYDVDADNKGLLETTSLVPYYSLGIRTGSNKSDIGQYSVTEGFYTTASAAFSHAEGHRTSACAFAAHSEGNITQALGVLSHSEGDQTIARGNAAHAEGAMCEANGAHAHAEGYKTSTIGDTSHAEGYINSESGAYNHVEGCCNTASGLGIHVSGVANISTANYQTVIGRCNLKDDSQAFIIGGGEYSWSKNEETIKRDTPVNILTVDWDGLLKTKGGIYTVGNYYRKGNLIGETLRSATTKKTIANVTWTNITAIKLPAGVYIITGTNAFDASKGGRLGSRFADATQGYNVTAQVQPGMTASQTAWVQCCWIVSISEDTTYYLQAFQQTGANLGVTGDMKAVRIA